MPHNNVRDSEGTTMFSCLTHEKQEVSQEWDIDPARDLQSPGYIQMLVFKFETKVGILIN